MARNRRRKFRRFEAQLELPLNYSHAEPASPTRSLARWQEKGSHGRPNRFGSKPTRLSRLYIAPASSIKGNITKIIRQSHQFWLTSNKSPIISKVIQNGWLFSVLAFPSLSRRQEPFAPEGGAYERRRGAGGLRKPPLDCHGRR